MTQDLPVSNPHIFNNTLKFCGVRQRDLETSANDEHDTPSSGSRRDHPIEKGRVISRNEGR